MSDNIVDFETGKLTHIHKRKEAKVEALKEAFRQARGESLKSLSKRRKKQQKHRK